MERSLEGIVDQNLQTGGHNVTVVTAGQSPTIHEHEATSGGHIPIVPTMSSAIQENECLCPDQIIANSSVLGQLHECAASCLPPVQASPIFELTEALAALGGDQAFLKILALMFLEDAPVLIADIGVAIELQDGHQLERSAHKLKGSASPFLASDVTDASQNLESIGESGQLAAAKQEYLRLEKAVAPLLTALSALAPPSDVLQSLHLNIAVGTKDNTPCTA